jgi:NUC173 domain
MLHSLIEANKTNEDKVTCYVSILSNLLNNIFALGYEYEALRGKTVSTINKMLALEVVINSLIEQKSSTDLVNILKYVIYCKNADSFQSNLSPKSMENLLCSVTSSEQPIRRSALQAFIFMFESEFNKNNKLMKQMTEYVMLNLQAWFMKKDEALYTLYFLNTILIYLDIKDIKKIIGAVLEIMRAQKSNPMLRKISCLVISRLFDKKHVQVGFTETLLEQLVSLADGHFYKATNDQDIISMVQVITSVYLNYNRGTPYKSKEKLVPVLNVFGELLSMDSDQQTNLDVSSLNAIKLNVTKNYEVLLIESCDEYLLNPEEEIDIFNKLSVSENTLDTIREKEGAAKRGSLNPRERIFVCLNNLCTSRFNNSATFVLQIISSFVERIHQLELGTLSDISNELIQLLQNIKSNFEFESESQKCMGKIVCTVDLEMLLSYLPVRAIEIDMTIPEYDEQSNSYILSLLCNHLKNGLFPIFYKYFWPQLATIHDKIEMQEAFGDSDPKE